MEISGWTLSGCTIGSKGKGKRLGANLNINTIIMEHIQVMTPPT